MRQVCKRTTHCTRLAGHRVEGLWCKAGWGRRLASEERRVGHDFDVFSPSPAQDLEFVDDGRSLPGCTSVIVLRA